MTSYDTGTGASTARTPSTTGTTNRPSVYRGSTYTETKDAWKTTEFWAYIATVVGVIVAAATSDNEDGGTFGAEKSLLYISLLTIGYMISRGLAKAGSREPYDRDHDHDH